MTAKKPPAEKPSWKAKPCPPDAEAASWTEPPLEDQEAPSRLPPEFINQSERMREMACAMTIGRAFMDRARRTVDADTAIRQSEQEKVILAALEDISFALDLIEWLQRVGIILPAARTIRGLQCPAEISDAIGDYWTARLHPGPFLLAVASNDLLAACRWATDDELAHLEVIVSTVAQGHPDSFGSFEKAQAWLAAGQAALPAPIVVPAQVGPVPAENARRGSRMAHP